MLIIKFKNSYLVWNCIELSNFIFFSLKVPRRKGKPKIGKRKVWREREQERREKKVNRNERKKRIESKEKKGRKKDGERKKEGDKKKKRGRKKRDRKKEIYIEGDSEKRGR